MPRTARIAPGGMVFHVLNRGVGQMDLFAKQGDFEAFERCIEKTLESCPMRIFAYCLMPNHWHFVVWPERDGDPGAFMQPSRSGTPYLTPSEGESRTGYLTYIYI